MKHTLRVPTEMYAFIETEFEGSVTDAVRAYYELTELVKVKPEPKINKAEFGRICTGYLKTGKLGNGGDLEFNPAQKYVLELITAVIRERNK